MILLCHSIIIIIHITINKSHAADSLAPKSTTREDVSCTSPNAERESPYPLAAIAQLITPTTNHDRRLWSYLVGCSITLAVGTWGVTLSEKQKEEASPHSGQSQHMCPANPNNQEQPKALPVPMIKKETEDL